MRTYNLSQKGRNKGWGNTDLDYSVVWRHMASVEACTWIAEYSKSQAQRLRVLFGTLVSSLR